MNLLPAVTALAERPLSEQHWAMERFHSCMVVAHRAKENLESISSERALTPDDRNTVEVERELFTIARDQALLEAARWLEKCPLLWVGPVLEGAK